MSGLEVCWRANLVPNQVQKRERPIPTKPIRTNRPILDNFLLFIYKMQHWCNNSLVAAKYNAPRSQWLCVEHGTGRRWRWRQEVCLPVLPGHRPNPGERLSLIHVSMTAPTIPTEVIVC